MRRVALEYNVPKSVLHDRAIGQVKPGTKPGAKPGPSQYLYLDDEEEELSDIFPLVTSSRAISILVLHYVFLLHSILL